MHSPATSPILVRKTPIPATQEKDLGSSSGKSNGKQSKPPPIVSCSSSGSSSSSSSSSSTSSMNSISKVPLIDASSNESSTLRVSSVQKNQEAPPIPPRKNVSSDFSRPMKPEPEVIESPQIPEQKPKLSILTHENFDDDEEDPICGPAETISGKKKNNFNTKSSHNNSFLQDSSTPDR